MTNQFIRKLYNPLVAAQLGASAVQTLLGTVQAIVGSARAKKLQQMLQPYQTPEEIGMILNATKNLASDGYDSQTLDYLTSNVDQAFASSAGIAKRLGADANQLSNLFNDRIQGIMKIGAGNSALKMENFSKYLGALDTVAANKAAEQKSKQDIIKNQIQAAVEDKKAGLQNISGGINTALSGISAIESNKLYAERTAALAGIGGFNSGASEAALAGIGGFNSGASEAALAGIGEATLARSDGGKSNLLSQELIDMIIKQLIRKT